MAGKRDLGAPVAAALELLGAGAHMRWPDEPIIGNALIGAGGIALIWAAIVWWRTRGERQGVAPYLLIGGFGFAALSILSFLAWAVIPHEQPPSNGASLPRKLLVAHLFADPQDQTEKAYGVYWGLPSWLYGWFGDNESREQGLLVPNEKTVSVYVTNVGPGDARYVKIEWALNSGPISDLVRDSGLFAKYITEIGQDHVAFSIAHSGGTNSGIKRFALTGQNDFPVLTAYATQRILLPPEVNEALFLSTLSAATVMLNVANGSKIPSEAMMSLTKPMPTISLRVTYEGGSEAQIEQKFAVDGLIVLSNAAPKDGKVWSFDGPGAMLRKLSVTQQ